MFSPRRYHFPPRPRSLLLLLFFPSRYQATCLFYVHLTEEYLVLNSLNLPLCFSFLSHPFLTSTLAPSASRLYPKPPIQRAPAVASYVHLFLDLEYGTTSPAKPWNSGCSSRIYSQERGGLAGALLCLNHHLRCSERFDKRVSIDTSNHSFHVGIPSLYMFHSSHLYF